VKAASKGGAALPAHSPVDTLPGAARSTAIPRVISDRK
jgi:hypothetical protein